MSTSVSVQEGPRPDQLVMQIGFGYILSAALYAVIKLGVADRLASGPEHVRQLAGSVKANEDALYRALRALATVGIFTEVEPRTFGLTPAADLLRSGVPGSVRELARFACDPLHFRIYAETLYSLQTGRPAGDKVLGLPVFEYFARDKEESDSFNDAMTCFSAAVVPAVLDAYDFGDIGLLVDVAGGHGDLLTSVLRRYPRVRGVLFDVEHVIAGAAPRIASMGLAERCRTESGDFFKGVPAGGDAYMMKHIIHDWDDDRAAVILGNVRAALKDNPRGRVILLEAVVQPANQPDFAKILDLEMLLLPGGRERNAGDFEALFARAGFLLSSVTRTQSPVCVIEGRPI